MDNKSSNYRIMTSIIQSGRSSSRELSRECGIAEPAVRYHLRKLKAQGLIKEIPGNINIPGAGRRASEYYPVLQYGDDNIVLLFRGVLDDWGKRQKKPAHDLADIYLNITNAKTNFSSGEKGNLREMISWLTSYHYNAFWEAGKNGPEIIFKNCPYRSIRKGSDMLCEMDVWILRKLGGKYWDLTERIDQDTTTGICRFIVNDITKR
ncbi:MAG: winged helix-turn-helix transcriptional regulator [Leptolinea sp.]|nr:winged helix-turn-helix transcriptional regulator [Leptolinea sp.]